MMKPAWKSLAVAAAALGDDAEMMLNPTRASVTETRAAATTRAAAFMSALVGWALMGGAP